MSVRLRAALLTTIFLWGSAFSAIRYCLQELAPQQLALLRFGTGSVILLVLLVSYRARLPRREHWILFVGLGVTSVTIYHLLLNHAQKVVPAGLASVIINMMPILSSFLAFTLLGERISLRTWCGIALGFSGVILISSGQAGGHPFSYAVFFIVGAALSGAFSHIFKKKLSAHYAPLEMGAYGMIAGTLPLLVYAGDSVEAIHKTSWSVLAAVLYLGCAAAFTFVVWAHVLHRMSVSSAVTYLYGVAPTAMIVSFLVFREIPGMVSLIGAALVLAGVCLVQMKESPPVNPGIDGNKVRHGFR